MTDVLDDLRLDADQFLALSPAAQDEYLALLAAERSSWSLRRTPKGLRGHLLAKKVDYTLLGGAASGGKSETMLYHAWELSKAIPNHRTIICRSSLPELRRSIVGRSILRFTQTGDAKPGKRGGILNSADYAVLRHQDNVRTWWFPNGSTIEMAWLQDSNVASFLSAEYDLVCIDESTTMSAYAISMLGGRLRTLEEQAALGVRPHMLSGSNPGGTSFAYHRDFYVKLTNYGELVIVLNIEDGFKDTEGLVDWKKVKVVRQVPAPQTVEEARTFELETDPETELSVAFVPFGVKDNPFVHRSVLRGLNALPDRERRRQLYGDWDIADDVFFPEFSRDVHVCDPFDVPDTWEVGIGVDHGFAKPFAAVLVAWDPDGECYAFGECYENRLTCQQQAEKMIEALTYRDDAGVERQYRPRHRVADPAAFSSRGEGKAVADQWGEAGVKLNPAIRDRKSGWANVREYLLHDGEDDDSTPKLHIMRGRCPNLVRELTDALTDKDNPEDLDTDQPDHALDALRYVLAQRPRKRKRKPPPSQPTATPDNIEARHLERLRREGRRADRRNGLR